jgi:hypothetical protein
MSRTRADARRPDRRGRPQKYGRPSRVVAVTLPQETVATLERLHSDLGWAIVTLVEKARGAGPPKTHVADADLVAIGDHQFLIVVNSTMFHSLPGVQMVPLSATQAFLALDPGRGMADLEVAVLDRLERLKSPSRERRAVAGLAGQLRKWRRDPQLHMNSRSIIIVAKRPKGRRRLDRRRQGARPASGHR